MKTKHWDTNKVVYSTDRNSMKISELSLPQEQTSVNFLIPPLKISYLRQLLSFLILEEQILLLFPCPNSCLSLPCFTKPALTVQLVFLNLLKKQFIKGSLELIKIIASQSSVIPESSLELVNTIKMNNGFLLLPLDILEYSVFIKNISILGPEEVQ